MRVNPLLSEIQIPGDSDRVALGKLRELKDRRDVDALREIDGGINLETIASCAEAGAELLVAGSAVFRAGDYTESVGQLQARAGEAVSRSKTTR